MKNIHNHPLFTDITPEEEVSVQGGNFWNALNSGANALRSWLRRPGNGIILWDNKNTSFDFGRFGDPGQDAANGWRWGIRDNGRYIVGGYYNTYNAVVDRVRKLLGV